MSGFFVDKNLNLDDHIVLTYFFESTIDPKDAAESLCQEQSTAQWCRVGVNEDFRPKHGAKILDLKIVDRPGCHSPEKGNLVYSRDPRFRGDDKRAVSWCEVKIAHPHVNFGARIPNILTAAAGEGAFFSHGITTIKLINIEFPKGFINQFEGPKFGVTGLRESMRVHDRPFFIGVVKPNIGLTPEDFSELTGEAFLGGLDIAKDDEMLSDVSWSPLEKRVRLCAEKAKRAEDATGEKKAFLANITDEVDRILELHDTAVSAGAGMVMLNVMAVGLSAVRMLRRHTSVPIVAHFDCIAPMSRIPFHGISAEVLTKFQRIAGCDMIIMPGFGERMKTPDAEVISNARICSRPLGDLKTSLPVPGGSDWAGTLPIVYEKLRTTDFGFIPGRGVFGHPMGPRGGAKSLRQAWEAIKKGIPLNIQPDKHPELKEAFRTFA